MLEKWEVVVGPPPNAIEFKHLQSTNKHHKHHNQNHDYKQLSVFGTKMRLEGSGHGTFFKHEKQPPPRGPPLFQELCQLSGATFMGYEIFKIKNPGIKFLACLPSRFAKHVSWFFFFPQNYNSKGKKPQTGHKNGSHFWVFQKHVDLETADKKFAGGKSICD